jgi:CheY-like chemotaxis protein
VSVLRQVLVVDRDPVVQARLSVRLDAGDACIQPRTVPTIGEAVRELEISGYDAVFLSVEEPRQASLILRVRATAPLVPLLAVVHGADEALAALARNHGADQVIGSGPGGRGPRLARALQATEAIIRRSRALSARTRSLSNRPGYLIDQSWSPDRRTVDASYDGLLPLVVEDDLYQAMFLKRAFAGVGLPFPLPVLRDGEEALAYLRGQGAYADRRRFPRPNLVVLDLRLPRLSGMDVLRWIRSRPEHADLVVFMLTNSTLPEALDRAIAAGADSWFAKPLRLEQLAQVARLMAVRWSLIRRALGHAASA